MSFTWKILFNLLRNEIITLKFPLLRLLQFLGVLKNTNFYFCAFEKNQFKMCKCLKLNQFLSLPKKLSRLFPRQSLF